MPVLAVLQQSEVVPPEQAELPPLMECGEGTLLPRLEALLASPGPLGSLLSRRRAVVQVRAVLC